MLNHRRNHFVTLTRFHSIFVSKRLLHLFLVFFWGHHLTTAFQAIHFNWPVSFLHNGWHNYSEQFIKSHFSEISLSIAFLGGTRNVRMLSFSVIFKCYFANHENFGRHEMMIIASNGICMTPTIISMWPPQTVGDECIHLLSQTKSMQDIKKKWEKKEAFFFVVFILTGNVTPNLSGRGDWHRVRCLWHVFSGFSILLNTRNDTASLNDVNEMNCIQMQGRKRGEIGGEVVTCFAVKNLWQRKPQEKVKKKKLKTKVLNHIHTWNRNTKEVWQYFSLKKWGIDDI